MVDLDVAFAVSINPDHIFFLIVLDERCSVSVKVKIILAITANHGAIVTVGIEVVFAVPAHKGVFPVPSEDPVISISPFVFV